MNHYVYIITNLMNSKKYIGKRSCKCKIEEDKYMGSGLAITQAIKKHGIENFEKKILLICNSEEEAFEEEEKAIDLVKAWENPMYYNISGGGAGFGSGEGHVFYGKYGETHNSTKIICLNTGEIFESIRLAQKKYNINDTSISNACKGKHRYAGKINGEYGIWRYYNDCIGMTRDEMLKIVKNTKYDIENTVRSNAIPVACVNTGEIFDSALKASKVKNISSTHITACCRRKCDFTGYFNGERLVWRYLEEYDENEDITEILDRGKIICLNTKEVFYNAEQASNKYDINRNHITEVCSNNRRSTGVHPDTDKPLVWMYLTDYKKATKEEINDRLNVGFGRGRYRKVVCLNTGEIFDTISNAVQKYNMKSVNGIIACCKNRTKTAGKHPETKEKLAWMYLEDYEKTTKEEIDNIVKYINKSSYNKPVICLNTGEIFEDMKIAEEKYNISQKSICRCANGKVYTAGKHPITKVGLVWMYLEDYENKYGEIDKEIS